MSFLNYFPVSNMQTPKPDSVNDERFMRDALGDLKHGLDLVFDLKEKLDKLHPIASETLIRMLSY